MTALALVLAALVDVPGRVGYPALAALIGIESSGIPVPGETALIAAAIVARHGPKAVFLGRWIALLRIAAAWLAGVNRMPWRTFLVWNALGGVAWATSVGLAAYLVGPVAETIVRDAGIAGVILILIVAVLLMI